MTKDDLDITNKSFLEYFDHRHNMQKTIYPKLIDLARVDIRNEDLNLAPKAFIRKEANTRYFLVQELIDLFQMLESKGLEWKDFKKEIIQIYSLPF